MNWKALLFPARRLRQAGLLSMNQRNGDFILPYNRRKFYPLVDDKLYTKKLAIESGIAVPELYAVVEYEYQIARLSELLGPHENFVVKPAHGSGGEGILIVSGRTEKGYRKLNGVLLKEAELKHHLSNILSGMYSLGGQPDKALIEYRVEFDPVFKDISYQGVPDIRTIVFRGIPVMSMLRLPTQQSDGKANLHQGAIGVGIDLALGITKHAVWYEQIIGQHPDTGHNITDLTIPYWEKMLLLSASCQELVSLGYLGVDIILDAQLGPLVLEMNARPGLSIQIANNQGLLTILKTIEKLAEIPDDPAERIKLGQDIAQKLGF